MRETPDIKEIIKTEADLCDAFITEFKTVEEWICHPETGGFDILLVHESGRQIGVEAKLQLNAKVADQIIPDNHWHRYAGEGPDHRLVIVRSITEANAGIAKMLGMLGVEVWAPRLCHAVDRSDARSFKTVWRPTFEASSKMLHEARIQEDPSRPLGYHWETALYDWNPLTRCVVPVAASTVRAGVPAPIRVTPWKMAAVRVIAKLRVQGYITAKEITSQGCSPTSWTRGWLDKGTQQGHWIETDRMPDIDKQHPELYAAALAAEQAKQKPELFTK